MAAELIAIEVAYVTTDRQFLIPLQISAGCTVEQAIIASGILAEAPEIDLKKQKVGIFSQICRLDKMLAAGDRVEIYRPLSKNPMEARRSRLQR